MRDDRVPCTQFAAKVPQKQASFKKTSAKPLDRCMGHIKAAHTAGGLRCLTSKASGDAVARG
jgi:hypothetical protein